MYLLPKANVEQPGCIYSRHVSESAVQGTQRGKGPIESALSLQDKQETEPGKDAVIVKCETRIPVLMHRKDFGKATMLWSRVQRSSSKAVQAKGRGRRKYQAVSAETQGSSDLKPYPGRWGKGLQEKSRTHGTAGHRNTFGLAFWLQQGLKGWKCRDR